MLLRITPARFRKIATALGRRTGGANRGQRQTGRFLHESGAARASRLRVLFFVAVLACVYSIDAAAVFAQGGGADGNGANSESINVFKLLVQGGVFMIPILVMSLMVVTFVIERFLGLRRSKVLPDGLVAGLGQLGGPQGGFDPRSAYKLCQQYPSAAANVVRAMLLKVGRPHSEVEHGVSEASEREANRLNANVRWLTLAAAVAPLLGLLGTVWGMIRAFHNTTLLTPDVNKAEYLAEGIYVALVTTLGGLCVAIPAAIFAHHFEGRIQSLFHEVDEMLFNLMPQVERFEGRVRFSRQQGDGEANGGAVPPGPPPMTEKTPVPK